jgi:hypothetical protein
MSLYAFTVTVHDLQQLQFGIQFYGDDLTDTAAVAAAINPPIETATVFSYANQLLASNISLSQVAMAVDSLMFGATDNTTELDRLVAPFLLEQVGVANTYGFNPTVYAAEALGLALAGGNGTSDAFATDFGSLSVSQFASEVAGLTGVNEGAIQQFAKNWGSFYTANPSATYGLSVTLASYGAAFGDAVGVVLLNPTVNGTIAQLVGEEQNALIDNAEGLYQTGIALSAEPAHSPLQGEAIQIPDAGGSPFGSTINWAAAQFAGSDYAQFVSPQVGPLTINNAPSTFTLDTQHYANPLSSGVVNAAGNGGLFTLILGDSTAGESLGPLTVDGYTSIHIVANPGGMNDFLAGFTDSPSAGSNADVVITGSGRLFLGESSGTVAGSEGVVGVLLTAPNATITDDGNAALWVTNADKIDASNGFLVMEAPADTEGTASGVTVLGDTGGGNILQGSVGLVNTVTFSNGSTGFAARDYVGADNITSNAVGNDRIFGDGGADTITLAASHTLSDFVVFGEDWMDSNIDVLAITNGSDGSYLGYWGETTTPTAIPSLFSGQPTGGTSADMTTITNFNPGSGGDVLDFKVAAWNGASVGTVGVFHPAENGDLVLLGGTFPVLTGAATLSPVWTSGSSNSSLAAGDNVLLYAPSGVTETNAQQLAAQLHTSTGAIVLPAGSPVFGYVLPGLDEHILVAYDASVGSAHAVNIADVDLVNMSGSPQNSTANLNVYASDMVHLVGVSLASLTSANINFV